MTKLLSFLLIVFNSLCICANVNADDELAENDYSDSHTSKIGRSFIESVGRGGVIGIAAGLASEQKEKEEERQAADIEAEKEAQEIYSQTFEDFLKNNKNYSNGQVGALSEYYESGGRGPEIGRAHD